MDTKLIKGNKMNKILKKINMAMVFVMLSCPVAFADGTDSVKGGLCKMIVEMGKTMSILRTLAFVGAAFCIASWAWGFISKGEVKLEDVQKKGLGVIVGFVLLFSLGVFLNWGLAGAGGMCPEAANAWK